MFDVECSVLYVQKNSIIDMKHLLALLIAFSPVITFAQSCSAPQPLTAVQESSVRGAWKGFYELNGERIAFTATVGSATEEHFVVITTTPLAGEAVGESHRFCGSGAFHFRKEFASGAFEFDGVPEGGRMKGTLLVEQEGVKQWGKFEVVRD